MKRIKVQSNTQPDEKCVVYSITPQWIYLDQLINSVTSLRKYNTKIKVHVFIYGRAPKSFLIQLKTFSVQLHLRPPLPADLYPFLVKWISIESLAEKRVLMLDVDTFFYDDVQVLFDTHTAKDIYARLAPECQLTPNDTKKKKGFQAILPQVMALYHRTQRTKHVPVINIGIVLFNHSFHKKIAFEEIRSSYNWLVSGALPYPSLNTFNRGEFALSLTLARIGRVRLGKLPVRLAPFYSEVKKANVHGKSLKEMVVCHVCYHNYFEFLAFQSLDSSPDFGKSRSRKVSFLNRVFKISSDYRLGRPPQNMQYIEALPVDLKGERPRKATGVTGPLSQILVLLNSQRTVSEILKVLSKRSPSVTPDFIRSLKRNINTLKKKGIVEEVV